MKPVPALELAGVRAGYGGIEVLRGVDLIVPAGTVVALLGPNGGGKSTTLRVAAGLHPPTAGDVRLCGRTVNGAGAGALAQVGVCTVPEAGAVFPNLTVRENLWMATRGDRSLDEIEATAYARFPALGQRRSQPAGRLSGGEQQMLALCRALVSDPALLLVDELSSGLAPRLVRQLYDQVAALAAGGVAVLLAEQLARVALAVADVAAIMLQGRVVRVGAPAEMEDEMVTAYLAGTTVA